MRWAMLALIFVARVGLSFEFQSMGSVADPLITELHLTYTEIGTLIGLFMLPGLFLAIPAGFAGRYASDRLLSAASRDLLGALPQLGDERGHSLGAARELVGAALDLRRENGHGRSLSRPPDAWISLDR